MFKSELDLRAGEPGEWILLSPVMWQDATIKVVVPRRFITDLASLPRVMRISLDRNGPSRRPAVVHDWLYCTKTTTRAEADKLFLDMLKAEGVSRLKRIMFYSGVRAGGWVYWNRRPGLIGSYDIYQGKLPTVGIEE